MLLHSRTMVLRLLTRIHLSFFDWGLSYLGSVDYNGFRSLIWPWSQRSRSDIFKISFMVCKHILLIYFWWCSYLAQWFPMVSRLQWRFQITNMTLRVKGQGQIFLTARSYIATPFMFWKCFIFSTMPAFGVHCTGDKNHQNDIGVKGQGQIYLKSVWRLITGTPLSSFDGVFLFSKMVAFKVWTTTRVAHHQYDFGVKG